jgi:hypothetical protein
MGNAVLPHVNLIDVTLHENEFVTASTLNRVFGRLFDNDEYLAGKLPLAALPNASSDDVKTYPDEYLTTFTLNRVFHRLLANDRLLASRVGLTLPYDNKSGDGVVRNRNLEVLLYQNEYVTTYSLNRMCGRLHANDVAICAKINV